jgi:hypothetical protein
VKSRTFACHAFSEIPLLSVLGSPKITHLGDAHDSG